MKFVTYSKSNYNLFEIYKVHKLEERNFENLKQNDEFRAKK